MQEEINNENEELTTVKYNEDDFTTLSWDEHIRKRPGMYIGKIGDGKSSDDGIYILLKEVIDNSVDEFVMGVGKKITIDIDASTNRVTVRDEGRGIPLGKLKDATGKMNTGAKIDSHAFKKSVGLNGVGLKAVNALSQDFTVQAWRNGETKKIRYQLAKLIEDGEIVADTAPHGTSVSFVPDAKIFKGSLYDMDHVATMVRNYTYLNTGLAIILNGKRYHSKKGLEDLLLENMTGDPLYPVVRLQDNDIEVAITHTDQYGDEFYSFVNGQHTTQGGTHLSAFKESVARVIKEYFNKNFEYSDIRSGMAAAISLRVVEPEFESQTKIKLGSKEMVPNDPMFKDEPLLGVTISKYVGDFLKSQLDDYLHMHADVSEAILKKVQETERERKAMSGVTKIARERAKKASLHNKKLRDCSSHLTDTKSEYAALSSIFITEGNSASGSITQSRNPNYQAVFSLRGKPLNCFGLKKTVVYENEEFNLLQAALNIEEGLDGLRYNRVIIATDADNDGMHIRLLILTFFLQFFPDLVRRGHVYILETPLYRVTLPRAKKSASNGTSKRKAKTPQESTIYCYDETELDHAIKALGGSSQITRFKGLGEISADEFKELIKEENIKLTQVSLKRGDSSSSLLDFYMGKNTPNRQEFIIENLVVDQEML